METQKHISPHDCKWKEEVIIPATWGIGLKWKDDEGKQCTSILHDADFYKGKRIAILRLSSYVGTMAIGAMHYYGRIEVLCPHASRTENGKRSSWSGYMGKNAPDLSSFSLNVTRILTKPETDMDGDPIGTVGEPTYRFNEEKEVTPEAIKLFKRKFGPGWILVPDSWGEDETERPVIAET